MSKLIVWEYEKKGRLEENKQQIKNEKLRMKL